MEGWIIHENLKLFIQLESSGGRNAVFFSAVFVARVDSSSDCRQLVQIQPVNSRPVKCGPDSFCLSR